MRVDSRVPVGVASVALIATLTACGGTTAGQPTSAGDAPSTSTNPPEKSTSTAPPGDLDFSNTALCQLLTEDEAEGLGAAPVGEPGYSIADGHPQCNWNADTGLTVGFQKGVQSTNARTGPGITNTPTSVAGLTAMQSRETDPIVICQVLVDVTPDSIVSGAVSIRSSGEGKYEPCDVASRLVNIIIPKVQQR